MKHTTSKVIKRTVAILLTAMLSLSYASVCFAGYVGGEEIISNEMDAFEALGFDTSAMPEGFDEDSADNPYGSNNVALESIPELYYFTSGTETTGDFTINQYAREYCGYNASVGSSISAYLNNKVRGEVSTFYEASVNPIFKTVLTSSLVEADFTGSGKKSQVVSAHYIAKDVNNFQTESSPLTVSLADKDGVQASFEISGDIATAYSKSYLFTTNNFAQVTAGDYDGDGFDEFAVYLPFDVSPRVCIYKLQRSTFSSETTWKNADKWKLIWVHELPTATMTLKNSTMAGYSPTQIFSGACPSNVSLASSDIDNDGTDDLLISASFASIYSPNFRSTLLYYKSTIQYSSFRNEACVLFGASDGTLFNKKADFNLPDDVSRLGISVCDADGDGKNNILLAGSIISDSGNIIRDQKYIGDYSFDGVSDIICVSSLNYDAVDGENTTDEDNVTTYSSKNGFDETYKDCTISSPRAAAVRFSGPGSTPYVFLENILFEYSGNWNAVAQLDDTNDPNSLGLGAPLSAYSNTFNVRAADINGDGLESLIIESRSLSDAMADNSGTTVGFVVSKSSSGNSLTKNSFGNSCIAFALPDFDDDSTLMEYTGNHYIEYSDPEVLAVMASSPYFKDVADIDESGNYLNNSSTEFASVTGSGDGSGNEYHMSIGLYLNLEVSVVDKKVFEMSNTVTYDYTKEYEEMTTVEQTISFGTGAGEDTVAFYSVPTEIYEYNCTIPEFDKNGNVTGFTESIVKLEFPHKAAVVSMPLEQYEKIEKNYSELPQIAGTAVTHTVGDPSTYPESSSGYDVIEQYDGDWAGVDFGNGYIEQSLAITEESSNTVSHGGSWDLNVGGGFVQIAGISSTQGGSNSTTSLDMTGTEFVGSVGNMPEIARDYGYYYAWKLFAYQYSADNGATFPVVNYLVTDVTCPPQLPTNFTQDYSLTTSTDVGLTWTYSGSARNFNIYRYYDFPEGGGSYLVGSVAANDYKFKRDNNGDLMYDDDGRPIKVYTFVDSSLNPYTNYDYQIQVIGTSAPPESIMSTVLTARTKSDIGNPELVLSDKALKVYPDTGATLTVSVANAGDYSQIPKYQWQKDIGGVWTDLTDKTSSSLKFKNADYTVAGNYRCRVNVVYGDRYLTSYTDICEASFSLRTPMVSAVKSTNRSNSTVDVTVSVTNPYSNSSAIPSGTLEFIFEGSGKAYKVATTLDSSGNASANTGVLPSGVYTITASYLGNRIFTSALSEETYILVGVSNGLIIEAPDVVYFNKSETFKLYNVTNNPNGGTTATEITNTGDYKYILSSRTAALGGGAIGGGEIYTDYGNITESGYYPSMGTRYILVYEKNAVLEESSPVAIGRYVHKPCEIYVDLIDQYVTYQTDEFASLDIEDYVKITSASYEGISISEIYNHPPGLPGNSTEKIFYIAFTNSRGSIITPENNTNPGKYSIKFVPGGLIPGNTYTRYYKVYANNSASVYVQAMSSRVTASVRELDGTVAGTVQLTSPSRISDFDNLKFPAGTELTFKATPYNGYSVKEWYVNGYSQNCSSQSFSCKALGVDMDVEVEYTYNAGILSYDTLGGGSVTVDGLASGQKVFSGSKWTFTATPDSGCHFKEWRVVYAGKGVAYPAGTPAGDGSSSYTLTMGEINATVYAVFERDSYTVNYTDGLTAYYYGDADFTVATPDEKITVPSGTSVVGDTEITVTAAPGYTIKNGAVWSCSSGNGIVSPDKSSCTFSLVADTFVTAAAQVVNFSINSVAVDYTPPVGNTTSPVTVHVGGEVKTSFPLNVPGGTQVVLSAAVVRGNTFSHWLIDGERFDSAIHDFVMAKTITSITAVYTQDTQYKLSINADTADLIDISYSINGGESKLISENSKVGNNYIISSLFDTDEITLTASDKVSDASGYSLKCWTLNGDVYSTNKEISLVNVSQLCDSQNTVVMDAQLNPLKMVCVTFEGEGATTNTGDVVYIPSGSGYHFVCRTNRDGPFVLYANGQILATISEEDVENRFGHYFLFEYTIPSLTSNTALVLCDPDDNSAQLSITGVEITPEGVTAPVGSSRAFTATVSGENMTEADKGVTWSISGQANSTISTNGNKATIAIGQNEANGNVITLKATSVKDTSKFSTVEVTVTKPTIPVANTPVVTAKTDTTITVSTVSGHEYAFVNGEEYGTYNSGSFSEVWTAGEGEITFTSLIPDTQYTLVSRIINAGSAAVMSEPVIVQTEKKAPDDIVFPTASALIYGQTLSESTLTGGVGNGTFRWVNGDTIPTVANDGYAVEFIPDETNHDDYTNYDLTGIIPVTVSKATPKQIIFPRASVITYGSALSQSMLLSGSGDGTFAWTDATQVPTVINDGFSVTFTPNDTDNYDYTGIELDGTISVTVRKAAPAPIVFPTASEIIYGQSLGDSAFIGGSGDGSFEWAYPTMLLDVGTEAQQVVFVPADDENYNYSGTKLTQLVDVTVNKAPAEPIVFPTASGITYGQLLSDSTLSGGEGNGTFTWDAPETAPTAGTPGFSVTFTPNDTATHDYSAIELTRDVILAVEKATPAEVVFPVSTAVIYGETLADSALTGGSGDGTFAWEAPLTVPTITNSGYTVVFTPNDAENYDYSEIELVKTVEILVNKMPGVAAPAAPVLVTRAQTVLTFEKVEGLEYSIDGGDTWQASATFENLSPETEYSVIARAIGSEIQHPGDASEATVVVTLREPITVDAASNTVNGIEALYRVRNSVFFTAVAASNDNGEPVAGDTRYVAEKWSTDNGLGGSFNENSSASYEISKRKSHTLSVTFREERFDGESWVATGESDTKTYTIQVETFMQMLMRIIRNMIDFLIVTPFNKIFVK